MAVIVYLILGSLTIASLFWLLYKLMNRDVNLQPPDPLVREQPLDVPTFEIESDEFIDESNSGPKYEFRSGPHKNDWKMADTVDLNFYGPGIHRVWINNQPLRKKTENVRKR